MATDFSLEQALTDPSALARPVCVALDGTLITTHVLWEQVVLLFRQTPWVALALPLWGLGGKSRFKRQVSERAELDPEALPYRKDLLAALRACRERGRKVVLATTAERSIADAIAAHLGVFDEIYAAKERENATAQGLRDVLTSGLGAHFDYVGHSTADLPLLQSAGHGYVVGAAAPAVRAAQKLQQTTIVSRRPGVLRALIAEVRPHQWAKNALVVLPVLLAPGVPEPLVVARAVLAAGTFSLCASAGYVFNDLLDLKADRVHATKSKRPFASGALPIVLGPPLFVGLLAIGFAAAALLLPPAFVAMLALYFVGTVSYSLYLKRLLLIDVLVLAGLYTHRILSGGIASGVKVSAWLLGFSMFLFTSLAFAKRYVELHALTSDEKVKNRGYFRVDLPMVTAMGTASGYIAALVFMLYVDSSAVRASYRAPSLLWLVLPCLLYWLGRIWLLAGRGQMQEDPVKFALKDRKSLLCVGIVGLVAVVARFSPEWLVNALH